MELKENDKIEMNVFYFDIDSAENKFGVEAQCSWMDTELYLDTEIHTIIRKKNKLGIIKRLRNYQMSEDDFDRMEALRLKLNTQWNSKLDKKITNKVMTKFIPISEFNEMINIDVDFFKREYSNEFQIILDEDNFEEKSLIAFLREIKVIEN